MLTIKNSILTVQRTKFGKSRYAPIHASTRSILLEYARRRDAHINPPNSEYFLVAERGGRLLPQYVYRVFHCLSGQIGLSEPTANTGPRLHDFRHRFAVTTLLRWYQSGLSVDTLLPRLSSYLGHSCVRDTYWYLSSRLLEQLTIAHSDGRFAKLINQLAKTDVLVLDDWRLETLTLSQRNDMLEIMEGSHGSRSTLITSQLPIQQWHDSIGDPTLADTILDRLLHNAPVSYTHLTLPTKRIV